MAKGWLNIFFHIHECLNHWLCLFHFPICEIFNATLIFISYFVCLNPCGMPIYPKIDKEVICLIKICTDSLIIIIRLKIPKNTGPRLKRCSVSKAAQWILSFADSWLPDNWSAIISKWYYFKDKIAIIHWIESNLDILRGQTGKAKSKNRSN